MRKGFDYTGICVTFYCHDGAGNYLFHRRNEKCRDEHGRWDCGGGGLKFGESLLDGVKREIGEEYGVVPIEVEQIGVSDVFREIAGEQTHWIAFRYKVLLERSKVVNNEPEMHEELGWFTLDNLPTPLHSQILDELELYKDKL
jgi:ADP-ribose pyrophosphatase YjhB (NUDIX family)